MHDTKIFCALAALLALALAACDAEAPVDDDAPSGDTEAADSGGEDSGPAITAPTFAELQADVFIPSCGGAGCHDASAEAAAGLDLESDGAWEQLMNGACVNEIAIAEGLRMVEPGDPSNSFLYVKVTDPMGMGDPMPPWAPLSDEDIEGIEAWILAGAAP